MSTVNEEGKDFCYLFANASPGKEREKERCLAPRRNKTIYIDWINETERAIRIQHSRKGHETQYNP